MKGTGALQGCGGGEVDVGRVMRRWGRKREADAKSKRSRINKSGSESRGGRPAGVVFSSKRTLVDSKTPNHGSFLPLCLCCANLRLTCLCSLFA